MKILCIVMILSATPLFAEQSSMYESEGEFFADLEDLATKCGTMTDGQVDVEIFGIQLERSGDRCVLGEGDVDPAVRHYLTDGELTWAGMHGEGSLWVLAR
ncbi:MAG: hypothetical protein ABJL72_18705 [Roseobacter sp.]|uniref:hypothetical protein n=1 Tax=Ascidiaceihabitans sp. TaxID=1872644 RepID=UPI003298241F